MVTVPESLPDWVSNCVWLLAAVIILLYRRTSRYTKTAAIMYNLEQYSRVHFYQRNTSSISLMNHRSDIGRAGRGAANVNGNRSETQRARESIIRVKKRFTLSRFQLDAVRSGKLVWTKYISTVLLDSTIPSIVEVCLTNRELSAANNNRYLCACTVCC